MNNTLIGEINATQSLIGEINKNLEYVTPTLQEKITTPTKQTQNITPDENYGALSKVVVNPIPSEYIIPNLQEKSIIPTSQTQNVTPDSNYDGLSKVVVNAVSGLLDWSAIGYNDTPQSVIDGYNYAKTIYDNWDSSQTSYLNKFYGDKNLVYMPLVSTSNGTSFQSMFSSCSSLTSVPQLDTSNGANFQSMFSSCKLLKTIPQLDTSNGTSFQSMFDSCSSLTSVPQLDTSNGASFQSMFYYCSSLTSIPQLDASKVVDLRSMFQSCSSLTNFGGLKDLGKQYSTSQSANYGRYALVLSSCTNLTHESLMNVINNLYDIASKGVQTQQLILGSTNLAKLTEDEIAIATNKGWNVS